MSCDSEVEDAIRGHGRRFTPQRLRVALALRHAGGHRTAEEIRSLVDNAGPERRVPLSTVYRALETLRELRLVSEVEANGRTAYEWVYVEQPHHHLVCLRCGAETTLDPQLLARVARQISRETGFEAYLDHTSLAGLCPQCRSGEATER